MNISSEELTIAQQAALRISERRGEIVEAIAKSWAEDKPPTLEGIAAKIHLHPPENYKSRILKDIQALVTLGVLEEVFVPYGTRRSYKVAENVKDKTAE